MEHCGAARGEAVALPSSSYQVNNAVAMANAVRAGVSIAMLSNYVVGGWIRRGDIVRMSDYGSQPMQIYALYLSRQCCDAKIKAPCDFLRDHSPEMSSTHRASSESMTCYPAHCADAM